MYKTKQLITLSFLLFLVVTMGSISPQSPQLTQTGLGTFITGQVIELSQTCANCTFVNISRVLLPNGTVTLGETEMTKNDVYYNISFSNSTDLGDYRVHGFGDPNGVKKSFVYTFTVTNSGSILSTAESIVYIIFLIGMIFIFLLSLWASIVIPFRNDRGDEGEILRVNDWKIVKVGAITLSYLILLFIFGISRSIMENYLFINGAFRVFNWLFWLMWSAMFPLMVLSVTFTIIIFLQSKKLKEQLERGVQFR